jgi:hypothetical protein
MDELYGKLEEAALYIQRRRRLSRVNENARIKRIPADRMFFLARDVLGEQRRPHIVVEPAPSNSGPSLNGAPITKQPDTTIAERERVAATQ